MSKMFRVALVATLVAVALGAKISRPDPQLDDQWAAYVKKYNKQYSPEEVISKRLTWEANLQFIKQHNQEADSLLHSYRVDMNEHGDMSHEEFVSIMNGYKTKTDTNVGSSFLAPMDMKFPKAVNWKAEGFVTEVKNQGHCGSDWAFSATGSLEGQIFRKTGNLTSLSKQNLVDCSGIEGNDGCGGGQMDQAFTYIKNNQGIDTESSYPYKGTNNVCQFNPDNVGATDSGFVDIQGKSESDLKAAVATVGPISVAIDAKPTAFQFYKSGVYYNSQCDQNKVDHGVLAVGYGQQDGKEYWLVKNSWGKSWGNEGYVQMSRNKENNCGIATQASYPTV